MSLGELDTELSKHKASLTLRFDGLWHAMATPRETTQRAGAVLAATHKTLEGAIDIVLKNLNKGLAR